MNLDTLLAFKFLEKKAGREIPLDYYEEQEPENLFQVLENSKEAFNFFLFRADRGTENLLNNLIRHFSFHYVGMDTTGKGREIHIYKLRDKKGNIVEAQSTYDNEHNRYAAYKDCTVFINGKKVLKADYKLISGSALKIYYFVERYLPSELKNYKEPIARTSGTLKASGIVNDPKNPIVSFTFGRFKRSGRGKEGTLAELLPTLSSVTANNIERVAEILGITWDKLYVYNLDNEAMVAAIGKSADGRDFMYDKYGSGMGGYSVVRSGRTKVNASTVLGGSILLADFQ